MNYSFILYHTNSSNYLWIYLSTNSNGTILGFRKICSLLKTLDHHSWKTVIMEKCTWSRKVNSACRFMCVQNPHHPLQALCSLNAVIESQLAIYAPHSGKPSACSFALKDPFLHYIASFLIKAVHYHTNVWVLTCHGITMMTSPE